MELWLAIRKGRILLLTTKYPPLCAYFLPLIYLGSPYAKVIQDSLGSHAVDSGFQVVDSDSLSVELGSRIPWAGLRKAEGYGFHKQIFRWFRNLDDLTGRDFVSAVSLLWGRVATSYRLPVFSQETDMKNKLPSYSLQRGHSLTSVSRRLDDIFLDWCFSTARKCSASLRFNL